MNIVYAREVTVGSSLFLDLFANEDSDLVSTHDQRIVSDNNRNNQLKPLFSLSDNARIASYKFGWYGRKCIISAYSIRHINVATPPFYSLKGTFARFTDFLKQDQI